MASSIRGDREYRQRDVGDKLGIKFGDVVAIAPGVDQREPLLLSQVVERTGRPLAFDTEELDVALVPIDDQSDAAAVLTFWRAHLKPTGGVWLLSPKRGQPGYVDQRALIQAGAVAGLVDNKVCAVSDTTSAMRFVIRRTERRRADQ